MTAHLRTFYSCSACGAEVDHDGDVFRCDHCRLIYDTSYDSEPVGEPYECDCSATTWVPRVGVVASMGPHEATCDGRLPDCTDPWHDNHGRPE